MPPRPSFLDAPRSFRWRRWVFQIHLWLGLTLGAIVAIEAFTGSIIMFRYELNRLLVPGTAYVEPHEGRLDLDELTRRIRIDRPRDKFVQVGWEAGPDAAWNFRTMSPAGHRIHTFINQYTGEITGQEHYQNQVLQWDLHATLLAGDTGRRMNGVFSVALLLLAVAGLILWWPGRSNWKFGFRYLRGARWQRRNYDLHKLTGFYASMGLAVIAFSGAYFSFPSLYKRVVASLTGTTITIEPPRARSVSTDPRVPLERYLQVAEEMQPGAQAISLAFPQKSGDPVTVRLKETRDWHRIGLNFVYFEPNDGRVIRSDRFETDSLGTKVALLMTPFHFGRFGGRFGRFAFYAVMSIYTVLGTAPLILFVTGALMYWNRTLSKWLTLKNRRVAVLESSR